MDVNERLLTELQSIKWILLLGLFGLFALVMVGIASIVVFALKPPSQGSAWTTPTSGQRMSARSTGSYLPSAFREKADKLSSREEWDALQKVSQEQQKAHPRNADGFLFEGIARMNKGEYAEAIRLFDKSAEVDKSWREVADAWIRETKRKAGSGDLDSSNAPPFAKLGGAGLKK